MRKSVFIFLSLLSTISASAQEKAYEPLLKEGKVWRYSYISYFSNEDHYLILDSDNVQYVTATGDGKTNI